MVMDKETKLCKKCKESINKKAKKCPHCGSKQGIPTWLIIIIIIVIVVIPIIAGVDSNSNESSSNSEKFTLVDSYKSDDSNAYFYYIEGHIKNNKNKDFSYVQVTFITYDAEGNTIGSCLDNNSGLSANGSWKFKAICTEGVDEIDHYELKEITGY
jgi:hypothetical protein